MSHAMKMSSLVVRYVVWQMLKLEKSQYETNFKAAISPARHSTSSSENSVCSNNALTLLFRLSHCKSGSFLSAERMIAAKNTIRLKLSIIMNNAFFINPLNFASQKCLKFQQSFFLSIVCYHFYNTTPEATFYLSDFICSQLFSPRMTP